MSGRREDRTPSTGFTHEIPDSPEREKPAPYCVSSKSTVIEAAAPDSASTKRTVCEAAALCCASRRARSAEPQHSAAQVDEHGRRSPSTLLRKSTSTVGEAPALCCASRRARSAEPPALCCASRRARSGEAPALCCASRRARSAKPQHSTAQVDEHGRRSRSTLLRKSTSTVGETPALCCASRRARSAKPQHMMSERFSGPATVCCRSVPETTAATAGAKVCAWARPDRAVSEA